MAPRPTDEDIQAMLDTAEHDTNPDRELTAAEIINRATSK